MSLWTSRIQYWNSAFLFRLVWVFPEQITKKVPDPFKYVHFQAYSSSVISASQCHKVVKLVRTCYLDADMDFCLLSTTRLHLSRWTHKTNGRRYNVVALNDLNLCKYMHFCTHIYLFNSIIGLGRVHLYMCKRRKKITQCFQIHKMCKQILLLTKWNLPFPWYLAGLFYFTKCNHSAYCYCIKIFKNNFNTTRNCFVPGFEVGLNVVGTSVGNSKYFSLSQKIVGLYLFVLICIVFFLNPYCHIWDYVPY